MSDDRIVLDEKVLSPSANKIKARVFDEKEADSDLVLEEELKPATPNPVGFSFEISKEINELLYPPAQIGTIGKSRTWPFKDIEIKYTSTGEVAYVYKDLKVTLIKYREIQGFDIMYATTFARITSVVGSNPLHYFTLFLLNSDEGVIDTDTTAFRVNCGDNNKPVSQRSSKNFNADLFDQIQKTSLTFHASSAPRC